MHRLERKHFALAALVLGLAAPGSAQAHQEIRVPAPYVNSCALAAAQRLGLSFSDVLPGPVHAAPRGMRIALLAGDVPVTCHIRNSFRIEQLVFG